MRIGLDFDNTLVRYDHVFALEAKNQGLIPEGWKGTKKGLKGELHAMQGGECLWQRIQGRVYGPSMHKASLFPGVARFLIRCRLQGHTVIIVSHKTEYGHFDPTKTPLRGVAFSWMDDRGFFSEKKFGLSKDCVFFMPTRREKVKTIRDLNLDVFVDDLEEVFEEEGFPKIKKVLFSGVPERSYHDVAYDNWSSIADYICGKNTDSDIKYLATSIYKSSVIDVQRIKGGGNSRSYKVLTETNSVFALKDYPDLLIDPRTRLHTEVGACRMLRRFHQTPKVIAFDEEQNVAIFEWVEGTHVTHISNRHIGQALEFVDKLKGLEVHGSYSLASEACLSASHLFFQIEQRLQELLVVKNQSLRCFLNTTFRPLWNDARSWSEQHWPKKNLIDELPETMQTFSPSDFGFHNALLQEDGSLCFLDLEYFGRDDPVKLMADFIWHPSMYLDTTHKITWIEGTSQIFSKDPDLHSRLHAAWPLYGLRWALILLNEFKKNGWNKRVYANTDLEHEREKTLDEQLVKSSRICQQIRKEKLECPYV